MQKSQLKRFCKAALTVMGVYKVIRIVVIYPLLLHGAAASPIVPFLVMAVPYGIGAVKREQPTIVNL